MAKNPFKLEYDVERRRSELCRLRKNHPSRVPVILLKAEKSDVPNLGKNKYLVPESFTVGRFVEFLRRLLDVGAEKAIFVFVKNTLPSSSALMSEVNERYKDEEDGFLYVTYSGENTFG